MSDAFFLYLSSFLIGLVASGLTTGALLWRFGQRCTSLEWAVGDIQSRLSSFKGKELATKRWDKRDQDMAYISEQLKASPPTRSRYDNDPLGTP